MDAVLVAKRCVVNVKQAEGSGFINMFNPI